MVDDNSEKKNRNAARLGRYRGKRDLARSPEPDDDHDDEAAEGSHPFFMVHKHHARRLHYDLRLQVQGVLASWALPRGPTLDANVKRLAVHTEDHPLAYGRFEGRIPDGAYGAGDSLIWDRGVFDTVPPGQSLAMIEKGHLDIVLMGQKLQGRFYLVRTSGQRGPATRDPNADGPDGHEDGAEPWLFFKAQDAQAKSPCTLLEDHPESVHSGRTITRGPTPAGRLQATANPIGLLIPLWPPTAWANLPEAADVKAIQSAAPDGQRAVVAASQGKVAVQSDEGRDLAAQWPQLVHDFSILPAHEAVIDGWLAPATGCFYALDLWWVDGQDIRDWPWRDRVEILVTLMPAPSHGKIVPPKTPAR